MAAIKDDNKTKIIRRSSLKAVKLMNLFCAIKSLLKVDTSSYSIKMMELKMPLNEWEDVDVSSGLPP